MDINKIRNSAVFLGEPADKVVIELCNKIDSLSDANAVVTDNSAVIAALEARCKELESALTLVCSVAGDPKLERLYDQIWEIANKALSTLTSTEHLHKYINEHPEEFFKLVGYANADNINMVDYPLSFGFPVKTTQDHHFNEPLYILKTPSE